jgi:purine-binding chemotaxis protein CheW
MPNSRANGNAAAGRDELRDARRDAIFARRAEALAASATAEADGDGLEALLFGLGGERYAFATDQVREVRPLADITVLPGMPSFVAGLANVRGRIVCVLDLGPLFGVQRPDGAAQSLVVLSCARGDVAVLATDRPSACVLPVADFGELPIGTSAGLDPAFVRGVTPDLVIVLDAERLLSDPRLSVRQDVPSRT